MLGEFHAFGGEAIDVWRVDFLLTEAADVAIAEVIGDEEDDVGFACGRGFGREAVNRTNQTGCGKKRQKPTTRK